jgi:PEP-CTERM motif
MSGKCKVACLALLVAALVAMPIAARADSNLGMTLTSGTTVTLCDNNLLYPGCTPSGSDSNGAFGQITYVGPVGNWTTNVTSGFGPPYEYLVPILDISSFNATSSAGAGPLTILLSVSSLTTPAGLQALFNSIGGTSTFAGTTITTQAWLNAGNTPFCASSTCGSVAVTPLLTVTGRSYNGAVSGSALFPNSPYALTLAVTINSQGQVDTTSFDDELDVPEPTTLSLLGSGLLGFGLALRKLIA